MNGIAITKEPGLQRHEPQWSRSLRSILQVELSPYPGRSLLVLRMVLACTLVTFSVMVFRLPGGVLGAYIPLLISRDNLHATKRSSVWIAGACTCATLEVILGAMLFAGSPPLHLLWVWGTLFAAFYLISILKVYEAALAVGLFLANSIGLWDQSTPSDLRVRQTLFMLLVVILGCVITVALEYLFAKTHPPDAVISDIEERLKLCEKALLATSDGTSGRHLLHALRRYSARGTATERYLIEQADYKFGEEQKLSAAVGLAARLVDLSISLMETRRDMDETDGAFRTAIASNLSLLRKHLSLSSPMDWVDIEHECKTCNPILIEFKRIAELLSESFSEAAWEPGDPSRIHHGLHLDESVVSAKNLFANEHFKFAIRGGLSSIVCYMLYMSVGWTGLNASIATCILTALPVTGAARHKQLMRFAGIVFGACVLGFTAQIIILPQIDSIWSYTLLFACVASIGAWISTSSPRISYAGVQAVLAYELVNVSRFSINPSLIAARDTVLGIILGIGAMWLVFDHLWAKTSVSSIAALLGGAIRSVADLSVPAEGLISSAREALLQRKTHETMKLLEKISVSVETHIFEGFPQGDGGNARIQRAQSSLPQLRAILLLKTGLIHHQILAGNVHEGSIATQALEGCTTALRRIAERVEADADAHVQNASAPREAGSLTERERNDLQHTISRSPSGDILEEHLSLSLLAASSNLALTV